MPWLSSVSSGVRSLLCHGWEVVFRDSGNGFPAARWALQKWSTALLGAGALAPLRGFAVGVSRRPDLPSPF